MKSVHRRASGAKTRARAGERAELRIDALAAGGAGVGRLAGEVVFVPATAPGDLVEVELDRSARPARGRLLRVIEPSAERVAPPCSFADACGGCDWMHVRVEAQQAAHEQIVRQAIARATSLAELPEVRVHPAPQALGYRSRARLFARAERGEVRVGYRAPRTHDVVAVDRCLVLADEIAPLAGELPGLLRGAAGEGDILIAQGASRRPVVEILWRGALPPAVWQLLDQRTASGAWAGARVTLDGARQAASFGDPRPVIQGADGAPLLLAPGGFGQPSEEGAAVLARRAAELAHLDSSRSPHLVELFAGSGTLSVLLARGAQRPPGPAEGAPPAAPGGLASFTAVELVPEAVACLRQNLAARGLAGKVIEADADEAPIPPRADVVVLDPPRGGAPGAARAIAASGARVVVYVSCDPATLARDLGVILRGGFEITDIEVVELFPQTSHIESIVRLSRSRRPRADPGGSAPAR
ncbi:class I SAM-dependent RNA methyltransferase [Sorangium sp. So ce131]|uniref:class I SAM-dependent RNA methyltransferase n=1 Tax=Sorangium sp. So ce131 TaxID=3133282 RepID=UPI003F61A72F